VPPGPVPPGPQPSMGWNCGYGGKCVQTPNGKYGDETTCKTACKPPPTNTYNCVPNASGNDRHCEATKGGLIGKYKSLDECNRYCHIVG
jgi:hypothetical protein